MHWRVAFGLKCQRSKGSPVRAGELEKQVNWQPGIDYIKANPTTGNVLVYYDSQKIGQERILKVMQELGYLQFSNSQCANVAESNEAKTSIYGKFGASVAQSIMEVGADQISYRDYLEKRLTAEKFASFRIRKVRRLMGMASRSAE